jgi:hypothetical protein
MRGFFAVFKQEKKIFIPLKKGAHARAFLPNFYVNGMDH